MKNIAKIAGYHFVKARPITKGLSGDKKYYLEADDGQRYLARLSECSEYERKKSEFKLLQKVSKIGIPMPAPVSFGCCEDNSKIYTLLTWIDGQDAHKVLPRLSFMEQYNLGMEAGRILRKLHDNSLTEYNEDWQTRYLSVIEPRLAAYKNEGVQFEGSSQVLEYLETNKAILSDRPQVFHHGDFHLGNMVINNGRISIIDWDTADFDNIGDPWYEFNRIGVEEPAFAAGQIDGYFGVNIPERFWRLFAYYQAGSAITSIVWAKYFAPQCMNEIMNLNKDIVHWYGGMQNTIPTWYVNTRAKVREQ